MVRSPYEQLRAARARPASPHALAHAREVGTGSSPWRAGAPDAASSLNGPIGPHRRYAWATTSVDDIKRGAQGRSAGTFNDVVLACITSGFRKLLLSHGEDGGPRGAHAGAGLGPPAGRLGVGLGDGRLANRVSAMFAELPVDIADPVLRLHAVTEQMKDLKDSKQAVAGRGADLHVGLCPAGVAGPRDADCHQGGAAQHEHGHHERARATVPLYVPVGG